MTTVGAHEPGEETLPMTMVRDMKAPRIPKTRSLSRVVVISGLGM